MLMKTKYFLAFTILTSLFIPNLLFAHTFGSGSIFSGSFLSGAIHPFIGLDHLIAMLAVGIWAAGQKQMAKYAIPFSFVIVMAVGACLGLSKIWLPFVEAGVLASGLVLGLLILFSVKPSGHLGLGVSLAITGTFALFHGHAHGEGFAGASALAYFLGFVSSTALLHILGITIGNTLHRHALKNYRLVQTSGALISLVACALIFRVF